MSKTASWEADDFAPFISLQTFSNFPQYSQDELVTKIAQGAEQSIVLFLRKATQRKPVGFFIPADRRYERFFIETKKLA